MSVTLPDLPIPAPQAAAGRIVITCMRNEGAWIVEWIAWHLAAGFGHFVVFTNDCEDQTEAILDRLGDMGLVTRRDNARKAGQRASYQIRALRRARREERVRAAEWAAILDADEFLAIKAGEGRLDDLFAAAGPADVVSIPWRVFGSGGRLDYDRGPVTRAFRMAAPEFCPRPAQAWGMKSLFRPDRIEVFGLHRPKAPAGGDWSRLRWVDAEGRPMPERYHALERGGWRFGRDNITYRVAQVNHYAVKSAQSYLMKVLRGSAHGGMPRDAGYWRAMDRNEVEDRSADRLAPAADRVMAALLSDPVLADLHRAAQDWHAAEIDRALSRADMASLMAALREDG